MKTPQELGKDWEEDFRLWVKELTNQYPVAGLRLYDSHSAGSMLPSQPGDFIACIRGRTHLFELKSSEKYDSFQSNGALRALLTDNQAAAARIWARAGAVTHVLFWGQASGMFERWDGKEAAEVYVVPRARLERPQFRGPDLESLKEYILINWVRL